MIKLHPYQKIAINFAKDQNNIFIEAPTGSGKSIMISYLAQYFANQGKKVIVSTSTNQLALQLLDVIQNTNFKDINSKFYTDIVIGKNNYLDLKNLDLKIFEDFIDIKEVIKELNNLKQQTNKEYLIDVFLDRLDIDEEAKDILSKLLQTKNEKENLNNFENVDISVTNHFYLIYKTLFSKSDFDNYVFIFDEVHQVSDAMETIYTNNFSLFRFKYLLNELIQNIKNLNFRGQKTLIKNLFALQTVTNDLLKATSKENLAGLSFINDVSQYTNIKLIIKHLTKENFLKLKKKLEKISLPSNLIKLQSLLLEEWNEFIEIANTPVNEIGIQYSSVKGYPRLSVTKKEYYSALRIFWNKINNIKGFSATLTIPNDNKYYLKRLNIDPNKKIIFYQITPIFKKEQINYYIVDKSFPKPNSDEEFVDIEWVKSLGDFIANTHENKNSLILLGSFLEVDALYDYLQLLNISTNVLKAQRGKSVYRIIKKFKKEGGILIATRNYGFGIDLKGKMLEKLYIAKLPYPVMGSKKWIELKKQDKLKGTNLTYFLAINEMLLNLKQWIGRLIRTPQDKGNLYILDSRVNKQNIYLKTEKLIKTMFK